MAANNQQLVLYTPQQQQDNQDLGLGPANPPPHDTRATLPIGGDLMARLRLLFNAQQRIIHILPGRDVAYLWGRITPPQIHSHRPSYINALLIQRAGQRLRYPCNHCVRTGSTPFLDCRSVQGHFGGCCGSCKWRDWASRCSLTSSDDQDYDSDDEEPNTSGGNRGILGGDGSAVAPLLLE